MSVHTCAPLFGGPATNQGLLARPLAVAVHRLLGDSVWSADTLRDELDAAPVCDNLALSKRHMVFRDIAQRGKPPPASFTASSCMCSINHEGELLAIRVTPGNVDDRKGLLAIVSALCGKIFDDKGCIGKEFSQKMRDTGIEIITRVRKNMKEACTLTLTAALLHKRLLVETVFDELKNLCPIGHTRHRSLMNFAVNSITGIAAYCLQPVKPRIQLHRC